MADQALYRSTQRGAARPGHETSIAIAGSIAFHALVLGYLALRGLSGDENPQPGAIIDPIFPYSGIPVDLVPVSPGEGRQVRLSRVIPHDENRGVETPAERSPDFHLPEPGRFPPSQELSSDTLARNGAGAPMPPDGRDLDRGPAPFAGPPRTSALACRTLAGALTLQEQEICDERFARTAQNAPRITGTGNPERDARFAAEGQARLDAYEALRAPLKPPTPCEGADMMGRCPAIITIPLFSRKF